LITAATTQFVQATVIYVQAYNRAQTKFEELQSLLNPSLNTLTFNSSDGLISLEFTFMSAIQYEEISTSKQMHAYPFQVVILSVSNWYK